MPERGILLLAIFVALPPIAAGQTAAVPAAPPGAPRLTLAAALNMAERQNLDLAAARLLRAVSLAGVQIAKERPNPTGFFSAARDTPHESLFFDTPIEIGGKRGDRIRLAKAQTAATEVDITALEQQVRMQTRNAYFVLAHARGVTQERLHALELAQRLLDIASARFQAGDIPQLDVIQAQLEVSRAQTAADAASQEGKVALSDLDEMVNASPGSDWDLGDALDSLPPDEPLDGLLPRADAANPEIQKLARQIGVQRSETNLLQAERIPNLGLEWGVDFNSPGLGGYRQGPRGQLSMEIPIFSRNQGEIAQSRATAAVLEAQIAAARRGVEARVASADYDFQAQRSQALAYRNSLVPSSDKLESMAEESYRAGKTGLLSVLTAQQSAQQVRSEYLDALLAAQTAFAQLEDAVGSPLD